jgi:hypothetical protein
MTPRRAGRPRFSVAPVAFRDSPIEGRGVFARRPFRPGEIVVPYAPRQRRLPAADPEALAAAGSKLTLFSDRGTVILPDTSVPGGWLCNHSCWPNAELYSSGEGRIQCARPIAAGEEVTIFYGWVTVNEPGRDPCRCGAARCRGTIGFDFGDADARDLELDTERGRAFRARLDEYGEHLRAIGQEHVLELIAQRLAQVRRRLAAGSGADAGDG